MPMPFPRLLAIITALAAVPAVAAEPLTQQLLREPVAELAKAAREQERLEDEVGRLRQKITAEERRAASGQISNPRELTAIQQEVEGITRRVGTLEDNLLERMEAREQLETELTGLRTAQQAVTAERDRTTAARDEALAVIDGDLQPGRAARDAFAGKLDEPLLRLYERARERAGGTGAAALLGNTCQGCQVSVSPADLRRIRALPADEIKRCENCSRILVVLP